MKKYLFSALVTVTGLFALAASAQAQAGDVAVQIKQDFTAGGKLFLAGHTRSSDPSRERSRH